GRMEMDRVPRAGYEIVGLPIKGLNRKNPLKNIPVAVNLVKSLILAKRTIKRFNPDIAIGVGGYASAPVLKEAQKAGIPTLIQEQNSYPGVTNKLLAKHVNKICVAYPDMEQFFPKEKIILTGNPIRKDLEHMNVTKEEAIYHFRLPSQSDKILLVLGGSLGARTINESVKSHLIDLAEAGVTLIWQTGKSYIDEARDAIDRVPQLHCHVTDFIERMDYAYVAADLVISRAGALSISEICLLRKPAILVPSPNVAEDHQTKNAKALSMRGAADLITDAEANEKLIPEAIEALDRPKQLEDMGNAAGKLATPNAAEHIVRQVEIVLGLNS
ncbi:MAG: undecaprenyldiphospho-muramoylpentapeptide beta-N-acetylglucosaminyltransferase, partial [Porphyromonadaceae bacterium]|nr:undecaprenyldiphospho-muramoylpentapeptide beta-N-acetylglucosaminyltransferase [Porphyromonadaceae bacterium]